MIILPSFYSSVYRVDYFQETENRYRKYQRRKPLRKAMAMQLEEVIIEEREEDLMEESSTDNIYHVIPPNQVRLNYDCSLREKISESYSKIHNNRN